MNIRAWRGNPWFRFWAHFILMALLWFFALTEYSWYGVWLDVLSPVILLWLAIKLLGKRGEFGKRSWMVVVQFFSTLGLWLLYFSVFVVSVMSPYALGIVFAAFGMLDDDHVDSAVSPNGLIAAHAHVRQIPGVTGWNNCLMITTSLSFFPLIERDVRFYPKVYSDEFQIRWKNEDTLVVEAGYKDAVQIDLRQADADSGVADVLFRIWKTFPKEGKGERRSVP